MHFEHAAPWLLGSYRFDEVNGDVRGYIPVGSAVLALRAHAGSVYAGAPIQRCRFRSCTFSAAR